MKIHFNPKVLSAEHEAVLTPLESLSAKAKVPVKVVKKGKEEAPAEGNTLDTLIPVQLPAADMEVFVQTFHTKRAAKAPLAFLEEARFLAEVSAYVNSVFEGLRYGLSQLEGRKPAEVGDIISRDIAIAYKNSAELEKKSKDYLMNMAAGKHHIIRDSERYKGGKDILYVGLRGANVSPLLSSEHPVNSQLPLQTSSYAYEDNKAKYESPFGKAIIATGMAIQKMLLGAQVNDTASTYARAFTQHQIGTGAGTNFVSELVKLLATGPLSKVGIQVMLPPFNGAQTEHAIKRLTEYTSILVLREPSHTIVQAKVRGKNQPDESLGICMEAQALQPDLRFSFALNLPKNFCEYITQTKEEQIPLVPLNTWANVWSAAMLRPPKMRSSSDDRSQRGQGTRVLIPERAPKYVLRPSVSEELIARRKALGLYSENGRVNEDGVMITYNGDLAFLPTAEDSNTENAKEYEKNVEEALALSFEAGTPLAAGQRGSTGLVFDLASPHYAEKITAIKENLSKFKGSVQAINWDLNTVLTVNVNDPDRLVSTKLVGANKPDELNIATYMRSTFAKGMHDMFSRTKIVDKGARYGVAKNSFSDFPAALTQSSIFTNFAHLYNHFLKQDKVPGLKDLVDAAAAALKIKNLGDEHSVDYEVLPLETTRTIYKQIIQKDLSVMEPDTKTGQIIVALLGVAATQASARSGTNLARICIRDNVEFAEHDRYFDGANSPVGDFARLYMYLGGEVFHQAIEALLKIPRKDLMSMEGSSTLPEADDSHPGFLNIVNEVMPMCVMFAKYVIPETRDKLYEKADELKEANTESKFTEEDLNLAGSKPKDANGKGGMKLFPHQGEALARLKSHPKIAVLDIAPGGGKCLHPDSLVPTKSGLLSLGELWEAAAEVSGRSDIRQLEVKVSTLDGNKPTDGVYTSHGKTRCVMLKDGTEFIGLPEHSMYALDEEGRMDFVRLDQMRAGTYLPKAVGTRIFPSKVPAFAKFDLSTFHVNTRNACQHVRLPSKLTKDFSQFLGLLVAEGYTPEGNDGVAFHNHDQDVLDFYSDVLRTEFNIEQPCQQDRTGKNVSIRLHNAYIGAFFSSILVRGLSAEKQVPMVVRQAPEDYQCAFLRGLFEGDGTIGKGVRARISYCSISKTLAYQVKAMLENIGIYCTIKSAFKSATNGRKGNKVKAYAVKLWEHTSNVMLFDEKIGFMSERKQSRLSKRIAHARQLANGQNTNQFAHGPYNKVPCLPEYTALIARIEDLLSEASYSVAFGKQSRTVALSLDKVLAEQGHRRKSITAKAEVVTRYNIETLFTVLDMLGRELSYVRRDAGVRALRSTIENLADFIWVPVVETKAGKAMQVYDLSVPSNHTYVVNGYLGHNTTIGIADIAMCYADGLTKRHFVFCPNRLVRNWIEDCHKSFNGWNVIPVTTDTYAEWGEERLTKMILESPPNTIVVIGNSFISNCFKVQLVIGNAVDTVSNSVEFCKKFQPDYVLIDESHRIRNPRSAIHQGIKTIMQMSSVKYGRIATGTLIQNVLSDVVGQSAVFNGQIFRTLEEFEDENKGVIDIVNEKEIIDYKADTPLKARRRMSEFATVISFKRKEWAFMLPMPVETFIPVDMEEVKRDSEGRASTKKEDIQAAEDGHKLRLFYDAVLRITLEEAKNDPRLKKKKKGEDDDDDEGDADDDKKVTTADGIAIDVTDSDDDSDNTDELEAALQPYLQRLERLLTDPFGDPDLLPVAEEIFGKDFDKESYVTPKIAKIIERIKLHFTEQPWVKGKEYKGSEMCDYAGKSWIFKAELPAGTGAERSDKAPDSDTERWKPQIRGKVFITCRYTRSVDAIFKALPRDLQSKCVKFHGEISGKDGTKDGNIARFMSDDKIQIMVANEMGISEGHNFQMASRFIRCEAPWAPGELDQTASRIFRPDVGGEYTRQTIFLDWILCNNTLEVAKMGRLISKMLKRASFDELDNPKYYKNLNPQNLPIIKMSLDNIRALYKMDDLCAIAGDGSTSAIHGESYIGQYSYLVSQMGQEFREMRATKRAYMVDVEPTAMPNTAKSIEFTPWVPNMPSNGLKEVANDGLIALKAALEDDENELAIAFKTNHKALIGQFVRTEFGVGVITKVTTKRGSSTDEEGDDNGEGNEISKVRVELSQGGGVEMLSASKVFLATKITERNKGKYNKTAPKLTEADKKRTEKQRLKAEKELAKLRERDAKARAKLKGTVKKKIVEVEPEEQEEFSEENSVALYPIVYNEFLALKAAEDDVDSKKLKRFGFRKFGDYAFINVKNYQQFTGILDFLEAKFTVPPKTLKLLDSLHDSFASGRGRKFQVELAPVSELPLFYRTSHTTTMIKNKKKPELKIYPIISNGNLMLLVDLVTNPVFRRLGLNKAIPGVSGAKFEEDYGMDICFFRNKGELVAKVKELIKVGGFTVTNLEELKAQVAEMSVKKALTNK